MKYKTIVIICSLLLAMPVLSFAEELRCPNPEVSPCVNAKANAKFKRTRALFNNKTNKKIRAKELAEKKAAEAEAAKKKEEATQDKGEGQVKVQF